MIFRGESENNGSKMGSGKSLMCEKKKQDKRNQKNVFSEKKKKKKSFPETRLGRPRGAKNGIAVLSRRLEKRDR